MLPTFVGHQLSSFLLLTVVFFNDCSRKGGNISLKVKKKKKPVTLAK